MQGTINRLITSSIVSNNLSSPTGQISSLTTLNISSLRGQVGVLTTSSIVSNNLSSVTSQVSSFTALNLSSVQGTINGLTTSSITTTTLYIPNQSYSWKTTTSNDVINTNTISNFNVGSSTFTMECYFSPSANPVSFGTIMSLATTATQGHEFRIGQRVGTDGVGFYFPTGPTTDGNVFLPASNVLQNNVWHHLALVRSSATSLFLYSNGIAILSTNSVNHSYNESKRLFIFDNPYPDPNTLGAINSARVVIGQALYTGNFTPPTRQLTTTTVGTSGANVAASLTGTVAFLGAITSTLTDSGPSALSLTVGGSPAGVAYAPGTFINLSSLLTSYGSNIGINCNTPAYRLDVNGTASFNNTVSISSLTASTIVVGPNQSPAAYANEITAAGFNMWSPTVFASTSMKCFVGAAAQAYFDMTQYVGGVNANTNLYFRSISSGTYTYPLTLSTSRVGINTINPLYTLDVTGSGRFDDLVFQNSNNTTAITFDSYNPTSTAIAAQYWFNLPNSTFAADVTIASTFNILGYNNASLFTRNLFAIKPDGSIGIGNVKNPQYALDVTGQVRATTGFVTPSDQRAKENIVSADTSICYSTMQGIDLKYFQWESTIQSTCKLLETHQLGFIAQDIKQVFPHSVSLTSSYGYDDFHGLDVFQINAMHFGATKKLMELMEQTIQRVSQLETLQQQSASTIIGLQQQLGSA